MLRFVVVVSVIVLLLMFLAPVLGVEEGESLLWHTVNFLVLITVIVYFGRGPVRSFLAQRRLGVEQGIERASTDLAEAEQRLAEGRKRVDSLATDLEEIRESVRRQARAEAERILGEARASAARIRRDGTAAVDQELRRAREQLRDEVASLAVEIARDVLRERITAADHSRLVDEFVQHLEREPHPPGPATRG